MSGLSIQERRQRLLEGYGFECQCRTCAITTTTTPTITAAANDDDVNDDDLIILNLSNEMDVESIRQIQYSCNHELMLLLQQQQQQQEESSDVLVPQQQISLVQMIQRGTRNQNNPVSHEVSIEAERLLAMAYTTVEELATSQRTS